MGTLGRSLNFFVFEESRLAARGIVPTYHNPESPYSPKPPAAGRDTQDWACLEVAVLGCPGPRNRVGRLLEALS